MKKVSWPNTAPLEPGDIVSIRILTDGGEFKYECKARLLEKLYNWRDNEPVPVKELSPNLSVNAIKSKWKVEVVSDSVFDNGRQLVRWVYEFHSIGAIKIKDPEEKEEDTNLLKDNNLIA